MLQRPLAAAGFAALALLSTPSAAFACGGLFCSAAAPVVQNRERIVFSPHDDGTMSMMVEIVYSGPSERFSWVLPVSGVPALSVGSTAVLNAIDNATVPQFIRQTEGTLCPVQGWDASAGWADASFGIDAGGPPVTVLDQGAVGPYDYIIISVDPNLPDPSDAGRAWLVANGYDVTPAAGDLLRDYLVGGQNLLAIKLQKNQPAGAIRPLVMRYASQVPVIPIRPTAVAASPGMQVDVFLLGDRRAVPTSYDELQILDAQLDPVTPWVSYPAVFSRAIDEVGGHGFVVEFAGAKPATFVQAPDRASFTALANVTDDLSMVAQAATVFGQLEGFAATAANHGVTLVQFVPCPQCVELQPSFDRAGFLADLDTLVLKPIEDGAALLERSYVTRLAGELDPSEMTVDPVFAYVSGLPDVSNLHTFVMGVACVNGWNTTYFGRAGDDQYIDLARDESTLPAFAIRTDYDGLGGVSSVVDRRAEILATVSSVAPPVPVSTDGGTTTGTDGGTTMGTDGGTSTGTDGGTTPTTPRADTRGCAAAAPASGGGAPAAWLAVALGLARARRRRVR